MKDRLNFEAKAEKAMEVEDWSLASFYWKALAFYAIQQNESPDRFIERSCWCNIRRDGRSETPGAMLRRLARQAGVDAPEDVNDYHTEKAYFRGNERYGRTTKLIENSSGRTVAEYMGIVGVRLAVKQYASTQRA